ncbi:unnamed protein product [Cyprideis torosa]|uniref:Uncharacterized protein n=1 Tax=Cyprideis torosa TaxID=163714 RepID=A0A7R8ZVF3_9CRUS|nr:unnamed protein product [Cyprideis torosa]CAG0907479.1 unnamed protein product [Cyprideis torosa]
MNEVANFCEIVGADVDKVRLGMGADERIGSRFLFPGIGYGGSCFPKDVKALINSGHKHQFSFKLLEAVESVNQYQKIILIDAIQSHFGENLKAKKIGLWGLAFKPNTDDIREASSLDMIEALLALGVEITAFDPAAMENVKRLYPHQIKYADNMYEAAQDADALIIATEWPEFRNPDFDQLKEVMKGRSLFDGRNLFDLVEMQDKGFYYKSIGFIGSHVIRRFVDQYPHYHIVNIDSLTYAGNLENLIDVEQKENYSFEKVDITEAEELEKVWQKYLPFAVIHLAAESHVDRSITDPNAFIQTNVMGTANLLNLSVKFWELDPSHSHGHFPKRESLTNLFYHVSTDEVYGALGEDGLFTEETAYDPKSPYSASKAASDHFVRAYGNTYGLPFVISNCSNNYGPNHFPEKLIPLCILNILNEKPLPIYGDGKYTRDWLYVKDHARAIDIIFHESQAGKTYNIGGWNEWKNLDLVKELIRQMDQKLGREKGSSEKLISFVKDRPGHDRRYAIDASLLDKELGWKPEYTFEEGLSETIDWYLENQTWLNHAASGAYKDYYKKQYQ